jgi:hypothetical protein
MLCTIYYVLFATSRQAFRFLSFSVQCRPDWASATLDGFHDLNRYDGRLFSTVVDGRTGFAQSVYCV